MNIYTTWDKTEAELTGSNSDDEIKSFKMMFFLGAAMMLSEIAEKINEDSVKECINTVVARQSEIEDLMNSWQDTYGN